ncbi:DUF3152 domain-containing protein [Streptomyces liliifuscus]|uniref:DUF3152 domain-containing protein n=1 Tax=Streptomyces liliifuscus TaxID=2797636 RepID=A0A7T7RHL2_9ACTN|nr:DUF3152 domain-containing protein [Streptomyces liliifuscus]
MNTTARRTKPSSTRGPSASRPSRRRRRGSAQSGGPGGSGGRSGGRGRKSKGPLFGGLAALVALVIAAAVAVNWTTSSSSDAADGSASSSPSAPTPDLTPEASGGTESAEASGKPAEEDAGKTGGEADTEPSGKGSPSASSSSSAPDIPASGPGTFATAGGGSGTVGKGSRVLSYKVVVENGLTQSPADVAEQVEGILADPRGWTADGRSGFRRVSSGTADFVVRLATPGTVDAICGKYGLNTRGEVNCNVGKDVVVNLKRWLLATPVYAADVDAYRALIINHEVGHFLGHGHVTCPGAGKPAPAMMQQIKGMLGCKPNVWPYDAKGRFVTGPAVS